MHPPPPPASKTVHHVLVDFENVHVVDLEVIHDRSVSLTLLIGAKQKKLDAELVETLLEHAASVQLVRLSASGKNALDFALAYHAGRISVTDPRGYIHIISRDTGFDPLVAHLAAKGARVRRHDNFSTLLLPAPPQSKEAAAPVAPAKAKAAAPAKPAPAKPAAPKPAAAPKPRDRVLAHLRKAATNRPKKEKSLVANVINCLGGKIDETAARRLIAELAKAGHLQIAADGTVDYRLGS